MLQSTAEETRLAHASTPGFHLSNILPEALLAVDGVRCIFRINREHVFFALVTGTLVHFALAAQRHTLLVATSWATLREWKVLIFVELNLLFYDNEFFTTGIILTCAGCGGSSIHNRREKGN